jgi:hypothetical protein
MENGSSTPEKAKAGTADFLIELENRRSIKVCGTTWHSFLLNLALISLKVLHLNRRVAL